MKQTTTDELLQKECNHYIDSHDIAVWYECVVCNAQKEDVVEEKEEEEEE
ncbi:MAG: hypothetical protein WA364_21935 [Candidatus Nitrosopolaris sp.]